MQSSHAVLAFACERQSDQIEQGKTFHMGYLIGDVERPSKALLANGQLSFLQCFASCSDGVKDPTPAGAVQFETMSTWLHFSFWDGASNSWTRKLDSVSRMNIFAKKGLPRSHLLWRPLGTFTTIGTEVFSWGAGNQVTVLVCACERQSKQFAQRKICHIGFLRGYIFLSIERPNKALLENHQHSFLHLVAWCSDWANTSGNGTVWNYGHLTSV